MEEDRRETAMSLLEGLADFEEDEPVLIEGPDGAFYYAYLSPRDLDGSPVLQLGSEYTPTLD